MVSKQTAISPIDGSTGFDQYNDPTDVWEYDYGPGAPGALLRHTQTAYLTTNGSTAYDALQFNGTTPDVAATVHLRGLPSQQSVFDAGGVERARTVYEYDNYAGGDNQHAPLTSRANISGLCTQHTAAGGCSNSSPTSYLTRGNVTGVTRYLLSANGGVTGSLATSQQYDIAGNAVTAIDARQSATTFGFADRFGAPDGEAQANAGGQELAGQSSYAFATSVTNALGQTAYSQYDYYTSAVVNSEDINGVVSSAAYGANGVDELDRPSQTISAINTPAQRQATFTYDDQNRTVTTQSDLM